MCQKGQARGFIFLAILDGGVDASIAGYSPSTLVHDHVPVPLQAK